MNPKPGVQENTDTTFGAEDTLSDTVNGMSAEPVSPREMDSAKLDEQLWSLPIVIPLYIRNNLQRLKIDTPRKVLSLPPNQYASQKGVSYLGIMQYEALYQTLDLLFPYAERSTPNAPETQRNPDGTNTTDIGSEPKRNSPREWDSARLDEQLWSLPIVIPSHIRKKLQRFEIDTPRKVLNLPPLRYASRDGVGARCVMQYEMLYHALGALFPYAERGTPNVSETQNEPDTNSAANTNSAADINSAAAPVLSSDVFDRKLRSLPIVIPSLLRLKLERYEIDTPRKVLLMSPSQFAPLAHVGVRCVSYYEELYQTLQSFFPDADRATASVLDEQTELDAGKTTDAVSFIPLPEKALDQDLRWLPVEVPGKLMKKLLRVGLNTAREVLEIRPDQYADRFDPGWFNLREYLQLYTALEALFEITPRYQPEFILPIMDADPRADFSAAFVGEGFQNKLVPLIDACLARTSSRDSDMVIQYFGMEGSGRIHFDQIREKYGLTRERVRQIVERQIHNMRKVIFSVACRSDPVRFTSVDAITLKNIRDIYPEFSGGILSANRLASVIEKYCDTDQSRFNNYTAITLAVAGFRSFQFRGMRFYVRTEVSKLSRLLLNMLSSKIHASKVPVSETELYRIARKSFPSAGDDSIRACLAVIEESEKTKTIDKQLYFQSVRLRPGTIGYEILRTHGAPLYLDELVREIAAKFEASGDQLTISWTSIITQFKNDGLVVACGRSGFWALKEWNVMTAPVLELIERAFLNNGHPMNVEDLFEEIQLYRRNITKPQVEIALIGSKKYILQDDGRYRQRRK